jgi:hypothetical protein
VINLDDVENLKIENQKLRNYIALIISEIEFSKRVDEIQQNFPKPSDSERIIEPIMKRISKIRHEKISLESELHLN